MKIYPELKVGDIVEIVLEQFGSIEPYVVRKIQTREQGEYSPNNSLYIALRKFTDEDNIVKTINHGEIIYKVKK